MALVRKLDPDWSPLEKRDLAVGETIEIQHPETLIAQGKVELADEEKPKAKPKAKDKKEADDKEA